MANNISKGHNVQISLFTFFSPKVFLDLNYVSYHALIGNFNGFAAGNFRKRTVAKQMKKSYHRISEKTVFGYR
jgi:hypothetical protein